MSFDSLNEIASDCAPIGPVDYITHLLQGWNNPSDRAEISRTPSRYGWTITSVPKCPEAEFLTGIQLIKGIGNAAVFVYGTKRAARVGPNLNRLIRDVRLLDTTETNSNGDKVIAHGKVKAFHGFAQVELTRSTKTGKLNWRFTMLVLDSWQNRNKVFPRTFKAQ